LTYGWYNDLMVLNDMKKNAAEDQGYILYKELILIH